MMNHIEFKVRTVPRPWKRPRSSNGRFYTDPDMRRFMDEVSEAAACAKAWTAPDMEPVKGIPVEVSLTFFKKCSPLSKQYGDIDNLVKVILDAMTGIIYADDCCVMRVFAEKYYCSYAEYIEVEVDEITFYNGAVCDGD